MPTSAKWSGWSAGSAPAGTDKFVGLQGGVNVTYAFSQLFANPSGTISTSASNGTAVTAMRSDATPALASTIAAGGPTGSATVVPIITYNAAGQLTAVTTATITQPLGANPTASLGLSAINGSAGTFLRSDGAPALDATIAPTWSGLHTFTLAPVFTDASGSRTALGLGTAATQNTGTSGATLPFLNGANTFSGNQTFSGTETFSGAGSVSTSAALWSGTLYASGTGTTNLPHVLIAPSSPSAASTWNTAGTMLGFNSPSGFAGNQIDIHANGGTSVFSVAASGSVTTSNNFTVGNGSIFQFNTKGILTSPAAGSFQLGNVDVDTNASIVAQTLRSQGALAGGTSDQAGKDWTCITSPGKGTGAGGNFIVRTSPGNGTGTTVNAAETGLTITGPARAAGVTQRPSVVIGNQALTTTAVEGFLYIPTCAGTPTGVPTAQTGRVAMVYDTTNHQFWFYDGAWLQPKTPAGAALVTWQ